MQTGGEIKGISLPSPALDSLNERAYRRLELVCVAHWEGSYRSPLPEQVFQPGIIQIQYCQHGEGRRDYNASTKVRVQRD